MLKKWSLCCWQISRLKAFWETLSSPKLPQFKVAQMAGELIRWYKLWQQHSVHQADWGMLATDNLQIGRGNPQAGALSINICQKLWICLTLKFCSLWWKPRSRTQPLTASSVKSWPKGVLRAHKRGNVGLWAHSRTHSMHRALNLFLAP